MRYILLTFFLTAVAALTSLTITDTQGGIVNFSYNELNSLTKDQFTTTRVKEGETKINTWSGFRFDYWLESMSYIDFTVIRFESADRYMVNISKAEFDTLECWLVFAQDGKAFADTSMRIIFPALRDMKWVRDVDRVVLEAFDPLKMPASFSFLDHKLKKEALLDDPAPFEGIKGYYFADLLPVSARDQECSVLLYSRDGMKLSLEYPKHLEGSVLEATDEGLNLKSPQIPGGMWLKDIIYIQINDFALINSANLDALITLNRIMDWKLSPNVNFMIPMGGAIIKVPLNTLLAHPGYLANVDSFVLEP